MGIQWNRVVVGLAVLTLSGATTIADTLVLRDGRRIRGDLRNVRDGVIEFAVDDSGRLLRIDRREVARIELDDEIGVHGSGRPGGRPRGLREREVRVAANVAWNDTGIDVRAGQDVYFAARGRVRWGPDRRDGAAGEKNSPYNAYRPIPGRPAAALIGKVGDDSSDYFFIGDDTGPVRMRTQGRLFLAINDDYLLDNSGALTVTVYY